MNNSIVLLLLIFLTISCRKTTILECSPEHLRGYELGEMTVDINDKNTSYNSTYFLKGESLFFLTFEKLHLSECYNEWSITFKRDTSLFLNTIDTFHLTDQDFSLLYLSSSDTNGAGYNPASTGGNWMLLTEINNDTTEISGQFNLTTYRLFPPSTQNEMLPDSLNYRNGYFRAQLFTL